MEVTSVFKDQGDRVRLLILHSTKDDSVRQTVALLRANLRNGLAVDEHEVATLRDLISLPRSGLKPNVTPFTAHGDEASNQTSLFGDVDVAGNDIGTNAGVIKVALEGLLDDCVCLFGVCHFGQDLLKMAIVDQGGALACIAPKPGCT